MTIRLSGQAKSDLEEIRTYTVETWGRDHWLVYYRQLVTAFERSGLSPSDYLALVQGRDEAANQLVQEALHDAEAQSARRQALQLAFEASGKPVDEFAQMYGMDVREVRRLLSIQ